MRTEGVSVGGAVGGMRINCDACMRMLVGFGLFTLGYRAWRLDSYFCVYGAMAFAKEGYGWACLFWMRQGLLSLETRYLCRI